MEVTVEELLEVYPSLPIAVRQQVYIAVLEYRLKKSEEMAKGQAHHIEVLEQAARMPSKNGQQDIIQEYV